MQKNYKDFKHQFVGASDVAALVVVGMEEGEMQARVLDFGGDGDYFAYVIDEDCELPAHYSLALSFTTWAKIYDDAGLTGDFNAQKINIYRAGSYGVIVELKGAKKWYI
jgi:hypothetical protein